MNVRIPVSICLSLLLTLVLAGCADADEVKLTPSDGTVWDCFGYSVSISGEYAIVGAHYDNDKGTNSGSAYIFKRDGTGWTEQAKITASDGAAHDRFSSSVAISGDYAIVGACADDDDGSYSGSAYIFKRDGTTWNQQTKITANDGAAVDCFGYSVAISGDYAVVGAYLDDDGGSGSGSAYIFKRDGTTWSQQTKITASDGVAKDYFGCSVAISGNHAIVGAFGDDDNGIDSGSAYIFRCGGTGWVEQVKITASDGDFFGVSVAISGDYVIVGACYDGGNVSNSGSAYIFKRNDSSWTEQVKVTASDGAAFDEFGRSVAISGDYTIVGAYYDDDNGHNSGSAYIFKRNNSSWSKQAKIIANDGAVDDHFGCSVAISGDYAIVGVHCDDDNGENSGSAYVCDVQIQEPLTGDLNGDDRLTPADAVIALKMAAGCCKPTTAADVNDDGVVNSLDALMILQAAAGLITL